MWSVRRVRSGKWKVRGGRCKGVGKSPVFCTYIRWQNNRGIKQATTGTQVISQSLELSSRQPADTGRHLHTSHSTRRPGIQVNIQMLTAAYKYVHVVPLRIYKYKYIIEQHICTYVLSFLYLLYIRIHRKYSYICASPHVL